MRFHILLVAIFATAASASDDQDREGRLDKLTFMHWNNKLPESEVASRKCIAV
jgi:ABC-type glycerol-3-phosphate transport system substrate-binding protein